MGPAAHRAEAALLKYLTRGTDGVRCAAALALGSVARPTPPVIAALGRAAGDKVRSVRLRAAVSLAHFGPVARGTLPALREAKEKYPKEAPLMRCAIWRLDPTAEESLPDLLKATLGGPPFARGWVLRTLGPAGLKRPDVIDYFTKLLASPSAGNRALAIRALTQAGPPARQALPALRRLLRDPATYLRGQAYDAIEAIQTPPKRTR